jgi:hypothetical protein
VAGSTILVGPGTFSGNVTIPSGVTVKGAGMDASWLRGKVTYGSNCVVSDLRLGDTGYSVQHRNGAANSSFTRCRFRGGGGSGTNAAVLMIGNTNSGHHFTFTDCELERNCGTEDATFSKGFNIVSLNNGATAGSAQVDHVTFLRCHFGAANGLPQAYTARAGIEATNRLSPAVKGYSYISVIDCVFEKTGAFSIDFADAFHKSNNVVIRGNTIKGGGANPANDWGYAVCLEMPIGTIVENNTIYRTGQETIKFAYPGGTDNSIIRNNTILLDADNGITPTRCVFWVTGKGAQIHGNTVVMAHNQRMFHFRAASDAAAFDNKLTHKYAGSGPTTWASFTDSSNVRVTGNTLETAQPADLGWSVGTGNSNITTTPNILIDH